MPHNLRSANRNRNHPDNRNNNVGFRVASTLCAGAIAITVTVGERNKRSGSFMMSMVGARVELGARYRGGACPGRHMGSDRRHRSLLAPTLSQAFTQSAPVFQDR
jgi:hypothetical protein